MKLKWDFMTCLWVAWLLLMLYAGYRERNTVPLHWSGYSMTIPLGAKVFAGLAIAIWLFLWMRQRK